MGREHSNQTSLRPTTRGLGTIGSVNPVQTGPGRSGPPGSVGKGSVLHENGEIVGSVSGGPHLVRLKLLKTEKSVLNNISNNNDDDIEDRARNKKKGCTASRTQKYIIDQKIQKIERQRESNDWDKVIDGRRVFQPHSGQSAILDSEAKFLAAIAGTGGGKTALGPIWMMLEIQKYPNSKWMILAPTYRILERATVPTLIAMFAGTQLEGRYVEGRYDLPDKGVIYCLSTEREEGIEGGQIRGAWLDEAGQMTHKAWIAVQGRLGLYQGRALLTTTPYAVNWLKREFVDRFVQGDKDYFCESWASVANPAYSREEYDRARRTLPSAIFHMRYDGQFTRMEGRIFDAFDPDYNVRPCSYRADKTILVGCDFNVNPMAWVLCHRYPNRLEVFDEIFLRNVTTPITLNVLFEKYKGHKGTFEFYGDATGSSRTTNAALSDYHLILRHIGLQMAGRTIHFPRANPPRIDRFASTNGMLCSESGDRRLHISPHCVNLISDLEGRFYKLGSREPSDSEDLGHMTDALGYIIHYIWPIRATIGVARRSVIKTFTGG